MKTHLARKDVPHSYEEARKFYDSFNNDKEFKVLINMFEQKLMADEVAYHLFEKRNFLSFVQF